MTVRERITHLLHVALVAVAAIATTACPSRKEANEARASVYDVDFAIVYSQALAAVRELYPNLDEDAAKGIIRTAWHQVQFEADADDPKTIRQRDRAAGLDGETTQQSSLTTPKSLAFRRTFIRFDVKVVGGRPWRVRVTGHASEWTPGNAVPVELRGAAEPHWLGGRTDALVIGIHRRLKEFARAAPIQAPDVVDDGPVVDASTFGPIPPAAAAAAKALLEALLGRDYAGVRAVTAADVVWSFGADPGIDAALATWQADPVALQALESSLSAGCRVDGKKGVLCPPAATEQPGYVGWRARLEPRGASWKLTAFVQGD